MVYLSFYERVYANSEGAFRSYTKSQAALYLYARAEEKNKKPRSSGSVKLGYGVEAVSYTHLTLPTSPKV